MKVFYSVDFPVISVLFSLRPSVCLLFFSFIFSFSKSTPVYNILCNIYLQSVCLQLIFTVVSFSNVFSPNWKRFEIFVKNFQFLFGAHRKNGIRMTVTYLWNRVSEVHFNSKFSYCLFNCNSVHLKNMMDNN